jgi:flagellar motor switch protein FliM
MSGAAHRAERSRDNLAELFAGSSNLVERLPMLRVVLDQAAAQCTEDLAGVTEQPPQLILEGIESGAAVDLLGAHDGKSAVGVLHAPAWNARLVVSAERRAVYSIVETMLGGDGSQPPYAEDRLLSRVEVRVVAAFIERLSKALEAAFSGIADTAFAVEAISNEIDYDVIGRRHGPIAAGRFRLEAAGGGGEILVAMPHAALNPLRQALSRLPVKAPPKADDRWSKQIQNEITRTHIMLTAVLDERAGTLGEVAAFQVGQVVELNATAHGRVRLECNGERLMWCHLGKSQGKYTLRVDQLVDREQEFMDDILSG